MKATVWAIVIIGFIIVAMIITNVFSQFDLLQSRANQGIGTSTEQEDYLGY